MRDQKDWSRGKRGSAQLLAHATHFEDYGHDHGYGFGYGDNVYYRTRNYNTEDFPRFSYQGRSSWNKALKFG